jgi:hypothetical protein
MRQYEPIWIQVRDTGMCEISTHKAYHARIIKAFWKEKDMDLAFKLECSEAYPPIRCVSKVEVTGSVIKFTLIRKPLITLDSI